MKIVENEVSGRGILYSLSMSVLRLFGMAEVDTAPDPALGEAAAIPSENLPEVWIEPDSNAMRAQSLLKRCKIKQRTFMIGRRGHISAATKTRIPDFLIPEAEPYTLSKCHCVIQRQPSGVLIFDEGSRFGTKVNGVRIGGKSSNIHEVELGCGEHSLVLGRRDSVYRFRLIIR